MKRFIIEFGPREIGVALACALIFGGGFAAVQSYTGEAQENGLPMVLPYQGTLSKAGAPFTGVQAMRFKLYSDASGAAFWTSDPRNVDVVGGKFAVTLGDANDTDKLEAQDFRHSELYVELVVDGTTLSPMQRIAPAPQAITAAQAAGDFHIASNVNVTDSANIGGDVVISGDLRVDGNLSNLKTSTIHHVGNHFGASASHKDMGPVDGRRACFLVRSQRLTGQTSDKLSLCAVMHHNAGGGQPTQWRLVYDSRNSNVRCDAICLEW